MISSIRIEGYRGFEHFEMSGLGRVNLLVGTNNSGKTSVLEAIYLLSSMGDPISLWQFAVAPRRAVAADIVYSSRPSCEALTH
jgi:predicted ATPase